MFNSSIVISALFGRVGWKQPTQTDYAILSAPNTYSKSGLFFSDYHKILTIKNIKDTLEDVDITDADFNTYLEDLQKASINRVLNGVFNKQIVIEQSQLFIREHELDFMEYANTSKFVGIRINVAEDSTYSVKLNYLSLLFNGNVTFKIYCFHTASGKLWEQQINVTANKEAIVTIDKTLSISTTTNKGGEFLIGYFQDDLGSVKAINYTDSFDNDASLFGVCGFEAVKTGAATYDTKTVLTNNINYGINAELTGQRDFTNVIASNAAQFDEAVGLQMACDVIEQIIFSTRSNSTERITKEQSAQLYNDLNLDTPNDEMPYSAGLKNRLKREIQRLNKNFFPKDNLVIQC